MSNTDSARTRAPRGTRIVAAAFFTALQEIPDARRAAVAKAAQAVIRDALKAQRGRAATKSTI